MASPRLGVVLEDESFELSRIIMMVFDTCTESGEPWDYPKIYLPQQSQNLGEYLLRRFQLIKNLQNTRQATEVHSFNLRTRDSTLVHTHCTPTVSIASYM